MARSPALMSPSGAPVTKLKSKPLSLLKASAQVSSPLSEDEDAPPEDLAEKQNWLEKNRYTKEKQIGEGTYANVYRGRVKDNPSIVVAIKKIKIIQEFRDGIAPAAFRECKYLSELAHPNIIHLLGVFTSKDQNINLVLEYLPMGDLEAIIKSKDALRYGPADIKAWMLMVNRAVWWCHENHVLHRDIKPNNIFVASDGTLKLADFGLARGMVDPDPRYAMTTNVITMFYRPPELVYEVRYYTGKVDVWSVACVHAELLTGNFFLPCERPIELLSLICDIFGHPTEKNWTGVSKLPLWKNLTGGLTSFKELTPKSRLMEIWKTRDEQEGDLLWHMFSLDPNKRFSERQVLEHPYWTAKPRPTETGSLPKRGGGEEKMGEDLKRKGGEIESTGRSDKIARRLDFG